VEPYATAFHRRSDCLFLYQTRLAVYFVWWGIYPFRSSHDCGWFATVRGQEGDREQVNTRLSMC